MKTPVEQATLAFLQEQTPELADSFLEALPRAWRTTLENLLGAMFREKLITGPPVPLPSGGRLAVGGATEHAFGRVTVSGQVRVESSQGEKELDHPLDVFEALGGHWGVLPGEVAESAANLAMAYACVADRGTQLPPNLPDIDNSILTLERMCAEGHNLHPCGRVRTGMSPEESYRYAAECVGDVELRLMSVRADRMLVSGPMAAFFPAPAGRVVLAVHPWQLAHAIPATYPEELASAIIVPLERTIRATSTTSMRSVVTPNGLVLKTALDVLLTSTRRNISPATTYNGPRISTILTRIVASEPQLRRRVAVVRELAGVAFRSPGDHDHDRLRNLSMLIREDPNRYVNPGDLAVTGCALFASLHGRTVLEHLVGDPEDMLVEYAELLLPPVLRLLVKYGIALEAHLQNTVVVFRGERPVRLLLRDFAGIRVSLDRLRSAGVDYRPHPDSITTTSDLNEVRNKAFYAAVQANLAEVVRGLNVPDERAWGLIWRVCKQTFASLAAEGFADAANADRSALCAPTLGQKAFLSMRLKPDCGDIYHQVPNPLHHVAS